METEFEFELPYGYLSPDGSLYKDGVMRLASAGDEVLLLEDPRVKGNRAYLVILLLARVIVRLGPLQGDGITPECVERLFAADLAFLQQFYRRINGLQEGGERQCPHCGKSLPNTEHRTL